VILIENLKVISTTHGLPPGPPLEILLLVREKGERLFGDIAEKALPNNVLQPMVRAIPPLRLG